MNDEVRDTRDIEIGKDEYEVDEMGTKVEVIRHFGVVPHQRPEHHSHSQSTGNNKALDKPEHSDCEGWLASCFGVVGRRPEHVGSGNPSGKDEVQDLEDKHPVRKQGRPNIVSSSDPCCQQTPNEDDQHQKAGEGAEDLESVSTLNDAVGVGGKAFDPVEGDMERSVIAEVFTTPFINNGRKPQATRSMINFQIIRESIAPDGNKHVSQE